MTLDGAKKLLHPDTSEGEIEKLKYYCGFNRQAVIKTIEEACVMACECIDKVLMMEDDGK